MLVTLEEAKQYLRVDSSDDDSLISGLESTAEALCLDVTRTEELPTDSPIARAAVLYAMAYLYEHREEADHKELSITLRALLAPIREEAF